MGMWAVIVADITGLMHLIKGCGLPKIPTTPKTKAHFFKALQQQKKNST